MFRARFQCSGEDPRPIVWPIKWPYWVSGYILNNEMEADKAIVIAYVDSEKQLLKLWPDAEEIDLGERVSEVKFSDRFPKPDWYAP